MPRPKREEQFANSEICIVHAVQRCVRRAFLAGVDRESGKDYSFRKEWIRRRMEALASVFGIDVLSYAVMSNHLHVILRNRPDVVASWSDGEVAIRWLRVFPGRRLEEHLAEPTEHEVKTLAGNAERIAEIRQRMSDISWFMRSLAEPISRMANKQDECTGRFWEGRFKAQRIVDEAGLLACSMYVDLNPVRAAMASDPEKAPHTSAFDRIQAGHGKQIDSAAFNLKAVPTEEAAKQIRETPVDELRVKQKAKKRNPTGKRIRRDAWLAPLTLSPEKLSTDAELNRDGLRASDKGFLHVSIRDYLRLLRWTAKQGIAEASEKLPKSLATTLSQIGIDASMWRDLVWEWQRYFGKSICVGSPAAMRQDAERCGKHHYSGQAAASACFT
ncbi:transposase [Rhodopirellula sp. SWK7]|uniref:transposase n=1 Tax=Rhodopirellula sp. SWK7 TaxID=595460 RepID=UPI00156736C4|nr:transposase [Rhodopirellula sp. SWK7]